MPELDDLPRMPDGITPAWLSAALRQRGVIAENVTVRDVRLEQVGEGVGMMTELSRVVVDYAGATDAPASFIAKYPSQNPTNREVAMSFNLYERETRYFIELDPLTSAQTPHQYIAELAGDNFLLLMEDMGDYRCGDQIEGADLADTEVALDELAKLHGAFWNKVEDIDWVPHIADSYHADNMFNMSAAGWPNMASVFDAVVPEHIAAAQPAFTAALRDLQAQMNTPPNTLLHGDFRMENLLYGTRPEHHPLAIVDWQGPLLGLGMVDVALMLGQSTKTEVRRAHERALIERYVEGLAAQGVQAYGTAKAWADYQSALLYNWCYVAVVAGTLDASNARAHAWMSQMIARQVAATEDFDLLARLS